jgi:hypothetical protein
MAGAGLGDAGGDEMLLDEISEPARNEGLPVSGMTATVTIRDAEVRESGGWRQRFASLCGSPV